MNYPTISTLTSTASAAPLIAKRNSAFWPSVVGDRKYTCNNLTWTINYAVAAAILEQIRKLARLSRQEGTYESEVFIFE